MFTPIDTQAITREALRGSGPEEAPRRRRSVSKRYRWLRPRSTPVAPEARRAPTSGRSIPSAVR